MREYVLYGYKVAAASDVAALNASKTPKQWVPEVAPSGNSASTWAPFGSTREGSAYMDPSNPHNLTPAGTPKTMPNPANLRARATAAGQTKVDTGMGLTAGSRMRNTNSGTAGAAFGNLYGDAAAAVGSAYDSTVARVAKPWREQVHAGGTGLMDEAQKRWADEKENLKKDFAEQMNSAETRWDAKLQGYKTQLGDMAKKWGGTALAGGGSLLGLWALLSSMKGGGQSQMTPQQMSYMQQMRNPMTQQIFR